MNNTISLKPISDLLDKHFYIPNYQRGYRWEVEQVEDLLNDLLEFYGNTYTKNKDSEEIYCLQPLVVQPKKDKEQWEVVDGQQRLTTLFIILSCLNQEKKYSIEYQTRENSKEFLDRLGSDNLEDKYKENADFYHIYLANKEVKKWLEEEKNISKKEQTDFIKMINERVNFIWYELSDEEDPIKVFTRLNVGKIGLTEAELVKALFLNRNNFDSNDSNTNEKDNPITQIEIANDWDKIEYKLQDDRFWLFFHDNDYKKPTRIDFILNLIRAMDEDIKEKYTDRVYPTFTYFYEKFQDAENKKKCVSESWKEIYSIFATIEEWYNDDKIYHYIGYMSIFIKKSKEEFIRLYLDKYKEQQSKSKFIDILKGDIKKICEKDADLNYIYEENGEDKDKNRSKVNARPILLLHNIETIISHNKNLSNENKYCLSDFTRFSFHLFKKEKWDVEHIRPSNLQDFQGQRKDNDIKKYLYVLRESKDEEIKKFVEEYDKSENNEEKFSELWNKLNNNNEELRNEQKNKIWNFVLLDASTNREYGNSCFAIKREYILKKDMGIKPCLIVNKDGSIASEEKKEAAFVPVCTKKIFSKEYTPYPDNLKYWTEKDAAYYRMDIEKTLWWVLTDEKDFDNFKKEYEEYKDYVLRNERYEITFSNYKIGAR